MTALDRQRRIVHYNGRVQGVGFRYTVRQISENFAVTGFVENLADGRVRLVAEGERSELDRFLVQVAESMRDYIWKAEIHHSSATAEFEDFFIQR